MFCQAISHFSRKIADGPYGPEGDGAFPDNANPYYDIYDENIRCGRGAAASGVGVSTLTLQAGDEVAFWATQRDRINRDEEV